MNDCNLISDWVTKCFLFNYYFNFYIKQILFYWNYQIKYKCRKLILYVIAKNIDIKDEDNLDFC